MIQATASFPPPRLRLIPLLSFLFLPSSSSNTPHPPPLFPPLPFPVFPPPSAFPHSPKLPKTAMKLVAVDLPTPNPGWNRATGVKLLPVGLGLAPTDRRTIAIGRWGAETLSRCPADVVVEGEGGSKGNGRRDGQTGEILGRATDRCDVVGCHRGISKWSASYSDGLRTHVYKMNDGWKIRGAFVGYCSCIHRPNHRHQHHRPTSATNDIPYVMFNYNNRYIMCTGVKLSKILGAQAKILRGRRT